VVSSCSGGQVHIEACIAAIDGGAIFALAPVSFSMRPGKGGGEVEDDESKTVIAGNVAGSRGGGIATGAPLSVEFGYHLVCTIFVS
jgi:predicted outer membrane repeat protein